LKWDIRTKKKMRLYYRIAVAQRQAESSRVPEGARFSGERHVPPCFDTSAFRPRVKTIARILGS
jgi:hypothetical protein